jgi:small conductance mechanosensitive channel
MSWEGLDSPWLSSLLSVTLAAAAILLIQFLERRVTRIIQAMEPLQEGRRKQLLTLVATLRWVVVAFVAGSVILMVLSHFVDVTPVLASVGVIGLALSLGTQTLIKDVIGGFFILIENQYAVGDVVKIGDASGQVEQITLRSTSVRDLDGSLHVIPNGEVRVVSNRTREWSRAMVDVGVAYEEDLDRVLKVMASFTHAFAEDPDFAPLLIGMPEIVGPVSLEDSAVVIRVMATTKPGAQWRVEREIQKRVLQVCERESIELPYPRQEVLLRHTGPGAG